MSSPTPSWWDKPTLYEWDGTLILLRIQMWCDLCWAACMDGADAQTGDCRLCAQGDVPIQSSVSDRIVHTDVTGHKLCADPQAAKRRQERLDEAREWREAYRVVAGIACAEARRA